MRSFVSIVILVVLTGCAATSSPTPAQREQAEIDAARARKAQDDARQKTIEEQRQAAFDREWHEMHDPLPHLGDSESVAKSKMQAQGYTLEKSYSEQDGDVTEAWVHRNPVRYAYVHKHSPSGDVLHVDVDTIRQLPREGDDYYLAADALRDHHFHKTESTTEGGMILETWTCDSAIYSSEPTLFSLVRSNANDYSSKILHISTTTLSR